MLLCFIYVYYYWRNIRVGLLIEARRKGIFETIIVRIITPILEIQKKKILTAASTPLLDLFERKITHSLLYIFLSISILNPPFHYTAQLP